MEERSYFGQVRFGQFAHAVYSTHARPLPTVKAVDCHLHVTRQCSCCTSPASMYKPLIAMRRGVHFRDVTMASLHACKANYRMRKHTVCSLRLLRHDAACLTKLLSNRQVKSKKPIRCKFVCSYTKFWPCSRVKCHYGVIRQAQK
jgi:hypothetical protein